VFSSHERSPSIMNNKRQTSKKKEKKNDIKSR